MSSAASTTDPTQQPAAAPASKKKANKKKKSNKPKPVEAVGAGQKGDQRDNEDLSDEPASPAVSTAEERRAPPPADSTKRDVGANGHAQAGGANGHPAALPSPTAPPSPPATSAKVTEPAALLPVHTNAKLEAMSQERDALRAEVEQLRRQLESIQSSHVAETEQLRTELVESEAAKDHAEEQYQILLGRVEKIRETLGERLKRDKEELAEAKERVEELEAQNEGLVRRADEAEAETARLRAELHESGREAASLRSRSNLSQQNWLKEKEDMARQLQSYKVELDRTSSAMGEWEVIAMEQKSVRDSLADKVSELEEQSLALREAHDRAVSDRDAQAQAVDALQRALREIQDARKLELREMVESSEQQLDAAKRDARESARRADEAEAAKERLAKELERTTPFEKEVKEKNLLIGKLRHEAIVLNDHLTKALKYIKKNRPEENVDRQVVTNLFLQFLALDRSDPKKFQVLQVISGLLNWSEEQKEQAGLARPGTSSSSLRLPPSSLSSSFHRTPSTPSLNTEFFSDTTPTTKESLADLWAGFLERSVEEASASGGFASRKGSMSSNATGGGGGGTPRPEMRGG